MDKSRRGPLPWSLYLLQLCQLRKKAVKKADFLLLTTVLYQRPLRLIYMGSVRHCERKSRGDFIVIKNSRYWLYIMPHTLAGTVWQIYDDAAEWNHRLRLV